jgi:predicted DsbA family dithiol-disulfide isomerase
LRVDLERRYGQGFHGRLFAMFDEAGLPHAESLEKVPNSRKALMVAELARERGAFAPLHPRLFDAYWARGRDIGDEQILVEEAAAVGLEEGDVLDVLRDGRYMDRIEQYTHAALQLGAGGVPAWLIDERFLVPGAQPYDVFARVLERLGHAPADGGA